MPNWVIWHSLCVGGEMVFRRKDLMEKRKGEGVMNSFTFLPVVPVIQMVMVLIGNGLSLGTAVAAHVKVHPVPFAFGKKT